MTIEEMVLEFHRKYGHYIAEKPTTDIPIPVKQLRMALITEEWEKELLPAIMSDDLAEIADGAADLIYVVVGTCISYGIPIDRIFSEVHRSNMTKTAVKAPTGEKYGTKTPKGPDFLPPDIPCILWSPETQTQLEKDNQ